MTSLLRVLLPITLLVAGAARAADPIVVELPRNAAPPSSTLTRAEVEADFYLWRLAGMQEFARPEHIEQNERYQNALARYKALRASSQYAELVQKIQGKPFPVIVGR
jgi:hypothetical protein